MNVGINAHGRNSENVWRRRGYDDGVAGKFARHPLNASEADQGAYAQGYRHGRRARVEQRR